MVCSVEKIFTLNDDGTDWDENWMDCEQLTGSAGRCFVSQRGGGGHIECKELNN